MVAEHKIDRQKLISGHNPVLTEIATDSPLTVGNGELAFTADITGMQTLYEEYQELPLCTMSQWGWHTKPVSREKYNYTLDDLVMKELTPPVPLYVQNMIYLRKKRGYSQGELATVLGLQSASSIDLVESGKCELPVSKLVHLAEFFGVTMDQITKQDLSQEVSGCRQQ